MTLSTWLLRHADDLQVVIFLVAFSGLALAERRWPARTGEPRARRWRANLALTVLNLATFAVLPFSLVAGAGWARARGIGLLNLAPVPAALAFTLTLLLRGLVAFLTHRAMHGIPALWRVHRVHHLDVDLDVSTTVRFHPLELVIGLVAGVPLVVALGLAPEAVVVYELLDALVTVVSHAAIRLPRRVERLLRYVLVTPDLHRIHHSSWQPETDSNFGAVFPIWDLVFGTFCAAPAAPHAGMELGLREERGDAASRVRWLLASPLRSLPAAAREPSASRAACAAAAPPSWRAP